MNRLPSAISRRTMLARAASAGAAAWLAPAWARSRQRGPQPPDPIDVPDADIVEAYTMAATQNVLAAVDDSVFPGYFSVCADRQGFGPGNTYPSLDGHQLTDALLILGRFDTAMRNFAYVRGFQKPDGQLPIAILPGAKEVAGQAVDPNGGLYTHWVPGNPLRALAAPTYIQNADAIFRATLDRDWLKDQIASVNLAADHLASLTTPDGLVSGAGYYVEFPTRIEHDGVAQCHAVDAFRRISALNRLLADSAAAKRYAVLASKIAATFRRRFWVRDHFGEYIHPERGLIDTHGLTDTNWAAIACGVADARQTAALWPRLRAESAFAYGDMPTGIAASPETYEDWEFSLPGHRHDLAAMGRVWYLECWARARMGDADGIIKTLSQVCRAGQRNGYYWRERYHAPAGTGGGPNTYCEYPANLIRIVERFVFGIETALDGALAIAPTTPADFWRDGYEHTVVRRGARVSLRVDEAAVVATYTSDADIKVRARGRTGAVTTVRLRRSTDPRRVSIPLR